MNSPSKNPPRPAAVEQGALPALPDWCYRDDLGGLVPSEIRTALNEHARAAWNMGLNACLLHAPAVTDTGLPELRDHLTTAKVMDRSVTLSPAAAGALHLAMTTPPPASPDVCAEMRALCSSCGGTGDVTRIDGEWMGYCNCGSAK